MKRSMKKNGFSACLLSIFCYLLFEGCTEPQDLITPTHFTRVPKVLNLQGAVGFTPTGKRLVLLTWEYDTSNSNIRSWDVTRSVSDTSLAAFVPLEIIPKPTAGFPSYRDTSGSIQILPVGADSVDYYYRIVPNGSRDNFVGQPSDILHIIFKREL